MNNLFDLLICPSCLNESLLLSNEGRVDSFLFCSECGGIFPVQNGIPQMIDVFALLRLPVSRLAVWRITQQRAFEAYRNNDVSSCSDVSRDDVLAFREFMDLRDKEILDIGSGSFNIPGYVHGAGFLNYIGIDPLETSRRPNFPLVSALAEFLPFRNQSFDVVILATSLDHCLDMGSTMHEIRRILRPGGIIYYWGGISDDKKVIGETYPFHITPRLPLVRKQQHDLSKSLINWKSASEEYNNLIKEIDQNIGEYETQLVDYYHFQHVTEETLREISSRAGLFQNGQIEIVSSAGVKSDAISFSTKEADFIGQKFAELSKKMENESAKIIQLHTVIAELSSRFETVTSKIIEAQEEIQANYTLIYFLKKFREFIRRIFPFH